MQVRDVRGTGASRHGRWLVAVGLAYLLIQLVTMSRNGFGRDESVYLSQVNLTVPAAFFSAPRALGISWIAAPVAVFTTSVDLIRGYLAVIASIALVVAYWPWLQLVRSRLVPVAAALFAVMWPALYYGPQAMPNLWVALPSVAAVGWFLRSWSAPRPWRPLLAVAVAVAATAVVRPSDSFWLIAPMVVACVVVPRCRRWQPVTAIVGGVVVGVVPWVVAAELDYGGVLTRLHRASQIEGGTSPGFNVITALRAVNGPTLCRPCHQAVPITGSLLWLAGGALVVVAVMVASRPRLPRSVTLLPTAVGVSMAVPYLFLIHYSAPRFLLPSYGLLALPAAVGAAAVYGEARRRLPSRLVVGAGAAAVMLLVAYQLAVLVAREQTTTDQHAVWAQVAATLHRNGVVPPCVVTGADAPAIGFYAGCASRQPGGHDRSIDVPGLDRIAAREPLAVVVQPARHPPGWTRGYARRAVSHHHVRRYVLYLSPSARVGTSPRSQPRRLPRTPAMA